MGASPAVALAAPVILVSINVGDLTFSWLGRRWLVGGSPLAAGGLAGVGFLPFLGFLLRTVLGPMPILATVKTLLRDIARSGGPTLGLD